MAKGKTAKTVRYLGRQLLRDARYDNRVARLVLKEDREYSLKEADKLVSDYLRKRG